LKIIHHISMSYGPVRKAFQDAGVELQIHDNNLTKIAVCDVAEDDPQWESVRHLFQPLGINCRRVLLHRTGQELESVLQLDIPQLVPLLMDSETYAFERCVFCDRKKYKHVTGFFPSPQASNLPLFKSVQYFGSGASASRAVLVSKALYRRIKDAALKGIEFYACKP
jgi:hypothetical protein